MRRYRGLVVGSVVIVVGCRQILGIDDPDHEPDAQSLSDAPQCYGDTSDGSLISVCVQPTTSHVILDTAVNTDNDPRCASVTPPVGPEVCVLEAVDIMIDGQIALTGHRPLVIVGTHTISISSTAVLDASSRLGTRNGPDANDSTCPTLASAMLGGGGAGGSFGATGGNGGGSGAKAALPQVPIFVRGGCAGSTDTSIGVQGSGPGGGAVYLIAGTSIEIDGVILANGGGGRAPNGSGGEGGGGGGAGGLIGLAAPMGLGGGAVMAVGGGGGEGGPAGPGSSADGQDPSGNFGEIAKGGSLNPNGGNGGNGGGFTSIATSGGSGSGSGTMIGGGGGGGGSVGVVWVRAKMFNVMNVSPAKRP
ncbi:MAG TPA: hypothetical protein VGO00_12565 [Kofleriaceae bacterium]|nr:hypothetical protein [Kofleriaceae bacterium]